MSQEGNLAEGQYAGSQRGEVSKKWESLLIAQNITYSDRSRKGWGKNPIYE